MLKRLQGHLLETAEHLFLHALLDRYENVMTIYFIYSNVPGSPCIAAHLGRVPGADQDRWAAVVNSYPLWRYRATDHTN